MNVVDTYIYRLDAVADNLHELESAYLHSDEKARAARFRVSSARRLFVAARVLLRRVLQHRNPAQSDFIAIASADGKPRLAGGYAHWRFNLSHSGECVQLALAQALEVGVDLQQARLSSDVRELAERILHPDEWATFQSLAAEQRAEAFWQYWVLKEAYVKMHGGGLALGLQRIHLDRHGPGLLSGPMPARLLYLSAPPAYYSAVAVAAPSDQPLALRQWRVSELAAQQPVIEPIAQT